MFRDKFKKRIKEISSKSYFNKVAKDTMQKNADLFEEFITEDQLYEDGVNAKGIKLDSFKPYTINTLAIKSRKGQKTSNVTLRDTGEFHRKTKLKAFTNNYNVNSSDAKTPKLEEKYGDILNFTRENKNDIAHHYIGPAWVRKVKSGK